MAIKKKEETSVPKSPDCFIIMPISDPESHDPGHFKQVYQNIIIPSCEKANYKAVRADDVKQANLIHLDILKRIVEAPMAICDLSSRNPNVLFELGIRQAFDKPVVLIQEKGTPKIFDISPLRTYEYSKEMKYHEVLEFQSLLSEAITATANVQNDAENINSIVKLLALNAAQLPEINNHKDSMSLSLIQSEMRDLKKLVEMNFKENQPDFRISPQNKFHGGGVFTPIHHFRQTFENSIISMKKGEITNSEFINSSKDTLEKLGNYMDRTSNSKYKEEARILVDEICLFVSL
jgi:hypothetical protein